MGPDKETAATGFMENFQASIGSTVLKDLSISGMFWQDFKESRRRQVWDLIQSGAVTEEELVPFVGLQNEFDEDLDMNQVARYLQSKGMDDVLTDKQIAEREGIQEEALLGYSRKVMGNADAFGVLGQLAGAFTAYSLDPFMWASVALPTAYASRATGLLARTAINAGKAGLAEGALELARQPLIAKWRKDMGVDYSLEEGFSNVAMAVLAAGALGGGATLSKAAAEGTLDLSKVSIKDMRTGIRRFLNKTKGIGGMEEAAARENLEDFDLLLAQAADEDTAAIYHLREYQKEVDRINSGWQPPPRIEPDDVRLPAPKVEDIKFGEPTVLPEGIENTPVPMVSTRAGTAESIRMFNEAIPEEAVGQAGPVIRPANPPPSRLAAPPTPEEAARIRKGEPPPAIVEDSTLPAPEKTNMLEVQNVHLFDEVDLGDAGAVAEARVPLKQAIEELKTKTEGFQASWRCFQNIQG